MKKQIIKLMMLLVALLSGTAGKVNAQDNKLHVKYWNGTQHVIDSLNLGVRPAGAWKEPFEFTMYTNGPSFTVNNMDFTPSDGLFSLTDEELPFEVTNNYDIDLHLTTNGTTAGVNERLFVAITEDSRAAHIWPVVVELYQPSSPDVYELARDLGTIGNNYSLQATEPQAGSSTAPLHNDYTLPFPEIPDGYDVVYKFTVISDVILSASVSQGENGKVALYTEDFNGEGGPMADNHYIGLSYVNCNNNNYDISPGPNIENLPILAGTYYLVASSTDPDFEVSINVHNMPCPIDNTCLSSYSSPENHSEHIAPDNMYFRWGIPQFATRWRLIYGTDPQLDVSQQGTIVTNWSNDMVNIMLLNNLLFNRKYYWYVEFDNNNCNTAARTPTFDFTTKFKIPQNLNATDITVFNDEQIDLSWITIADDSLLYYNVYRDGISIGQTTGSFYSDGPLAYNMNGYTYSVTAVYSAGESAPSNSVNVKVSGYGDVNGHVYEEDGQTVIANATVTLSGKDEFGGEHTYNFTTNVQGYYSGQIYSGSYNGSANKQYYATSNEPVQGNPVSIQYNETTSPIDFILELKRFTITYMDGETELNVDTFFYQQPITDYTLSREGWTFDGWNPAVPALMPAESLTVYAQWTRICDSVTDYDNNHYASVNINNLCWMASNLRTTHFADGRDIANVYEYQNNMYPNTTENVNIYGRLYDWYDAVDAYRPATRAAVQPTHIQGICPDGWRLPTEEDFDALDNTDLLSLRSTDYWVVNNGTNSTGFDMRGSGLYNLDHAQYEELLCKAYIWTATATSATEAHCREANYYCNTFLDLIRNKANAFSVRCVKD